MQQLCCQTVLFFAGHGIKGKEHASFVNVVERLFIPVPCPDAAVFQDEAVHKPLHKITVALIAADFRHFQQRHKHAAVDIVPVGRLSPACLFDVPRSALRRGMLDEIQHVAVDILKHHCTSLRSCAFTSSQFGVISASPCAPSMVTSSMHTLRTLLKYRPIFSRGTASFCIAGTKGFACGS